MNQIINGGKRKTRRVNKSFKAWVTFVKKVQKEEKLSYKDAIHRAKIRKDKGEKWMTGGGNRNPPPEPQPPSSSSSSSSSSTSSSSSSPTNDELARRRPGRNARNSRSSLATRPTANERNIAIARYQARGLSKKFVRRKTKKTRKH